MRIASLVLLAACGGGGGQSPLPDAPEPPDAPPQLTTHRFVIDAQNYPTNNSEARELGLDINGDATVDNQLGMVVATLTSQGFDAQGGVDSAVDRGDVLTLVELGVEAFGTGAASFTLLEGANPQPPACANPNDTVCRKHFAGGSFDVAATSADDPELFGSFSGGVMQTSGGGVLHLQTTVLAQTPLTLELIGARVKITSASESGITSGVIAGAITQNDLDTKILPGWQVSFDATVQADCQGVPPDCGCTPGGTADTMLGLFDTAPKDCTISLTEIQDNSLIQSLLAPDVTVNGQNALSLGIGFTAVPATFTP